MAVAYYTVVYRVDGDKAKQEEWWASIRPLWMAEDGDVRVTAVSKADEITRLDCLREIVEGGNLCEAEDDIQEALDALDPKAFWDARHPETETAT